MRIGQGVRETDTQTIRRFAQSSHSVEVGRCLLEHTTEVK